MQSLQQHITSRYKGNISRAAAGLGVSRPHIYKCVQDGAMYYRDRIITAEQAALILDSLTDQLTDYSDTLFDNMPAFCERFNVPHLVGGFYMAGDSCVAMNPTGDDYTTICTGEFIEWARAIK